MNTLTETALLTEKQAKVVMVLHALRSPFCLTDEQPYISKRVWYERHKLSAVVMRSLAKRKIVQYGAKNSVRLTPRGFRLVAGFDEYPIG